MKPDQPKPTGEACDRCDGTGWIQDSQGDNNCETCDGTGRKPTGAATTAMPGFLTPTGWTGIMLSRLIKEKGYQGAAEAINAAVDDEREKLAGGETIMQDNEQLRQQLDAEREKHERTLGILDKALAAEREETAHWKLIAKAQSYPLPDERTK